MKTLLVALLLLACPARAELFEAPKTRDSVLLGAALVTIWLDAGTSIDMLSKRDPTRLQGHRFWEADPAVVFLAGTRFPSPRQFITIGAVSSTVVVAAWAAAPQRFKWLPATAVVLVDGAFVAHNLHLVYSFPW